MLKIRKKAKFEPNSWVNISQNTSARASKFYAVLWLELSNVSLKFGALTENGVDMLKVRKTAKFGINLWHDISWTTTAMASKVCVALWLEPSNVSLKFGVFKKQWTKNGVEMLKVRKIGKFDLISWLHILRITTARTCKFCVALWVEPSNISQKIGVLTKNGVKMFEVRKTAKFDLNLWLERTTEKLPNFQKILLNTRTSLRQNFNVIAFLLKVRKTAK